MGKRKQDSDDEVEDLEENEEVNFSDEEPKAKKSKVRTLCF
jgi:hypothetical protein